jgi:replicative DNA helicase
MSARRAAPKIAADLSNIIEDEAIPKALDSEAALLGTIIEDGRAAYMKAQARIEPAAFYSLAHQIIFSTCGRLAERGIAIDPVTVKDELAALDKLGEVGGPAYLARLADAAIRSVNIDSYIGKMIEAATKRRILAGAINVARTATNGHTAADLLASGATLYRVCLESDPEARKRCAPTADVMAEYSMAADAPKSRSVLTGFSILDAAIDGVKPGEVLTIIKRPQVGGSVIVSQVIDNTASNGEAAVFFSLEMPRPQAFERLAMQRLGLSRGEIERVAKGNWSGLRPEQRAALDALGRSVVIVDRGKSGIADLDAGMIEATAILGRPPRLAVIDYLTLLSSGAKNRSMYERVSEAAVDVKSFAKAHDVSVLLVSQASRSTDPKRTAGAAPLGIDAARDSGQVEEAADFVVCLWRPELDPSLSVEERREVGGQLLGRILKNRRGPLTDFRLDFDRETLRVRDWQGEGE